MPKCEKCGIEFDEWEAENEFQDGVSTSLQVSYAQLGRCLCGACAIEEFENGNYYEICECCGKTFNPCVDELIFYQFISDKITDADMYEFGLHCADCAITKALNSLED